MKIRVVSNAAIDLPEEIMDKYNIAKIPISLSCLIFPFLHI